MPVDVCPTQVYKLSPFWNVRAFQNIGNWYGGGESLNAAWPLEKGHIKLSAFVTGDEVRVLAPNKIRDIQH